MAQSEEERLIRQAVSRLKRYLMVKLYRDEPVASQMKVYRLTLIAECMAWRMIGSSWEEVGRMMDLSASNARRQALKGVVMLKRVPGEVFDDGPDALRSGAWEVMFTHVRPDSKQWPTGGRAQPAG